MKKIYFHNSFLIEENININTSPQKQHVIQKKISKQKQVVDINKLLNRVKIHKKNEVKKKIIFFSLITLGLFFFGILTTIIK